MAMRLMGLGLALALALSGAAWGQAHKDSVVLGMVLEPPGLDPTAGASASIGEITLGNIFEGLTKINGDGSVTPLLAKSWEVSADRKTWTFALVDGVKFQDGAPFSAADVKFSFERAAAPDSTNKEKAFYASFAKVDALDTAHVAITLTAPNPDFLFKLGLPTSVIVSPNSAPGNAQKPIGTGPFTLSRWAKGSSLTLTRWDGYRDAGRIALRQATFRILNDPAAQAAALLAGDIDAFPRFGAFQAIGQFQSDPRFNVAIGGTEGKTILAINNKRKPFDDVRVRRAIAHAIDRKAIIDGAQNGLGAPIGSHYVPIDPGYIDLTGTFSHDPQKGRTLMREAGIALPLRVTLTLPPPAYARLGGEIVAAQLAEIGVEVKIENVEWAQWLTGVYKNKNFDLTIISHVEPGDYAIYANPDYYFGYDSADYRALAAKVAAAPDEAARIAALGDVQRKLSDDAVNGYLFQLAQVTVTAKGLVGLWRDSPVFANDLSAVRWQ